MNIPKIGMVIKAAFLHPIAKMNDKMDPARSIFRLKIRKERP
jgi:hypothetical protein